eukprot:scaffold684_cov345-Pavlova_lutheri.AAC.42
MDAHICDCTAPQAHHRQAAALRQCHSRPVRDVFPCPCGIDAFNAIPVAGAQILQDFVLGDSTVTDAYCAQGRRWMERPHQALRRELRATCNVQVTQLVRLVNNFVQHTVIHLTLTKPASTDQRVHPRRSDFAHFQLRKAAIVGHFGSRTRGARGSPSKQPSQAVES